MKIGQLAAMVHISVDTVRYYERRGLIPAATRTASGYRDYRLQDVQRLRFIVHAKGLGFTLEEIRQLLALRTDKEHCEQVREVAETKARHIEERIAQLSTMRDVLLDLADQCQQGTGEDACPILKSLENPDA